MDPSAHLLDRLSYDEVIERDLRVMDPAAFVLARESRLPLHVFNIARKGEMRRILDGEKTGTYVYAQ